jgi:hypothetical protein
MKNQWLSVRNRGGRFALVAATLLTFLLSGSTARAQLKQGQYVTEAAALLSKLVDASNKQGYKLWDDSFSAGGGWLKQSQSKWVPLFTISLQQGVSYRMLAAGDADAKDVDLQIVDVKTGKVVAEDSSTEPDAIVDFTPKATRTYEIRVRLYASERNVPCFCLALVLRK